MISLLRTLSAGYVAQHRARTALVILSIALGVATLVATQAISRGLKSGVQDAVNPLAGLADLIVIKGGAGLPGALAREIREAGVSGVADARPFVYARVALVELDNRVTWLFGVEASGLFDDNPLGVKTAFRTPSLLELPTWAAKLARGEAGVVSADVVEALRKKGLPATTFSLRNAGRTPTFLLAGTVDFASSGMPVNGSVAVLPLDAASRVCYPEKVGTVQQINVRLTPGADAAKAREALQKWLGGRGDVQTIDASRAVVSDVTSGLELGMLIGSAGALVVGLFLVYNALSVSVAERRRDIGILRAVGATRGQVAGLFLGESLVMGLLGSSLGLPIGWVLAWLAVKPLAGVVSELLVPIEGATVNLPPWL
ncbi:MAG: ABC transporter permease, partial [Gemmataceae bacterium]